MSVTVGTTLPLEIRITAMPEYDDNDQYVGACRINGVPHHITLFRVVGDDYEQDAAPGHHDHLDALQEIRIHADLHRRQSLPVRHHAAQPVTTWFRAAAVETLGEVAMRAS